MYFPHIKYLIAALLVLVSASSNAAIIILSDTRYINSDTHTALGGSFSGSATYYEIWGDMNSDATSTTLSGDLDVSSSGGGYGSGVSMRYLIDFVVTENSDFTLNTLIETSSGDIGNYLSLSKDGQVIYSLSSGDALDGTWNGFSVSDNFSYSGALDVHQPTIFGQPLNPGTVVPASDPYYDYFAQSNVYTLDVSVYMVDFDYGEEVFTFDLTASPVPTPAGMWLFGSALLGLIGLKRRYN